MTGDRVLQTLADGGSVTVWAAGRPRTKGSLKPVHIKSGGGRCRVSLTESGEYAIAWKNTMIKAIREQAVCERFPCAVRVDALFLFERLCLPDANLPWPTREKGEFAHGDEDKLRRNALDALTQSGLILDDALVVGPATVENGKRWVEPGESPGVLIRVVPA